MPVHNRWEFRFRFLMSFVDQSAAQGVNSDRRILTILFTDLSRSTILSGALEAEVLAALIADFRRLCEHEIGARNGTVSQLQGDAILAVFGHPCPSEDDGRVAVEAALAIHAGMRVIEAAYAEHGAGPLRVHSGVHAGLTLVRDGDSAGGRLGLYGPAPGLAKHLSDLASADQILVSSEVLGPIAPLFVTEEQVLPTLQGSLGAVRVHCVRGRSALRTRFEAHHQRGLRPFVGRVAERRLLRERLAAICAGEGPSMLVLQGAPGLGKTRLAHEFLAEAEAEGHAVWRGFCSPDLTAEPLQPLLMALGHSPGSGTVPVVLRGLQPESWRGALQQHLLAAVAPPATVLFIDDWQWADDASRHTVHALLAVAGLPLLVLVTARPLAPEDRPLRPVATLALAPLDDAEADSSVQAMLPAADPFVRREIRRLAGGNPLFIEELCHQARHVPLQALLPPAAGLPATADAVRPGGSWLRGLIDMRLARLEPRAREVVAAAAVLGPQAPVWQVRRLTVLGPDAAVLDTLAREDLLFFEPGTPALQGVFDASPEHPSGPPEERRATLRFKHGLTRDAVYESLALEVRRALHRAASALLHDTAPGGDMRALCEPLALHSAGAGDVEAAARWAEMAGDKALAASALDRARAQYRAALHWLERLPDTPERYQRWRAIVRRLGLVCVYDPARTDLPLLRRAVDEAIMRADASGTAYAHYWLAYLHYALGEGRQAVLLLERARVAAHDADDRSLQLQATATLGQALAATAQHSRAEALLSPARALVGSQPGGKQLPSGVAYSLACLGSLLGDQGRDDEAEAVFDEALRAVPEPGHEVEGSVRCWRAGVRLWQGRPEAALADAQAAQRVAERVGSLYLYGMGRALAARAAGCLVGGEAALHELAEAAAWLRAHDKNLFASLHAGWLAETLGGLGRRQQARQAAARALARTRQDDWLGAAMASRAMARLARLEGRVAAAQRHRAMAERAATRRGAPHEHLANARARVELDLHEPNPSLTLNPAG
jgi:class 3 adenylate cyclase/tetratricopeptide (TPR) repeat protein